MKTADAIRKIGGFWFWTIIVFIALIAMWTTDLLIGG